MQIPRLYLGTMTFGWSQASSCVDESIALEMLRMFVDFNNAQQDTSKFSHVDTARIYAGGKTERILGEVFKKFGNPEKLAVGTKAHPSQKGGLSAPGLRSQVKASMQSIGVKGMGEYYLHQPDTEHFLLQSLQECDKMVKEGLFCCVGMSNYHSSEMIRSFDLCKKHKLTKPTVYQGLYNPLNRMVENDLLPALREEGCSFVAYNPLAAGLLTGKHIKEGEVAKGRFKNNQNYLPRFYTDENFAAIQLIQDACDAEGVSMVEASYRWLLCHSALTENDGVLIGASSTQQLRQNLNACQAAIDKGGLSAELVSAFDEAWKLTESRAFPYWRSYSMDMPNKEALDQGASYSAAKTK